MVKTSEYNGVVELKTGQVYAYKKDITSTVVTLNVNMESNSLGKDESKLLRIAKSTYDKYKFTAGE